MHRSYRIITFYKKIFHTGLWGEKTFPALYSEKAISIQSSFMLKASLNCAQAALLLQDASGNRNLLPLLKPGG
jgi:hypothetical protein